MTELQRYLAEEVAEDHADGIITRREAMRRLGLLGVTASAATAMLTRAAQAASAPRAPRARHDGGGRTTEWAPVATEEITFAGPRSTLMGAWAPAERSKGGVLVVHENRGLTDHIREVAGRLAASGYSALALDLLSERGGTGAFPDEAAVGAALNEMAMTPENFDADMQAALGELQRRLPDQGLAAIGFCFGGGMVWRLVAAGEDRLDAAAPFYGPFPEGGQISGHPAVLGVYAGMDDRVNATRAAAQAALEAARVRHEILIFTEAQHAFFNDTNPDRFNAPAAAEAWRRVVKWFHKKVEGDDDHDDDDDDGGR